MTLTPSMTDTLSRLQAAAQTQGGRFVPTEGLSLGTLKALARRGLIIIEYGKPTLVQGGRLGCSFYAKKRVHVPVYVHLV